MTKVAFKLKSKEREFLTNLTKTGNRNSREFERAYVLLALDKGKKHEEISEFYNVSELQSGESRTSISSQVLKKQLKMIHGQDSQLNIVKQIMPRLSQWLVQKLLKEEPDGQYGFWRRPCKNKKA